MPIYPRYRIGACYSNGDFGRQWAVRQIIAILDCDEGEQPRECVHFKVLVGDGRRRRFTCTLEEFDRWARYEVRRNENSWARTGWLH